MLTPPTFLVTHPDALVSAMVAAFEATTGKILYPAQVERLLIDIMAYRESLVRQEIQHTAEQNLVDFATGDRLEALARLVRVASRQPATKATCTWTISIPSALAVDSIFPAGWQAVSQSGEAWEITEDLVIPAGQLAGSVNAQALVSGTFQNGLPVGSAFSPLSSTATVVSTTLTGGGSEAETDDQLRARTLLAPFGFSVAGSAQAYAFFALGASPSIIDVSVETLAPGTVGVYPLTASGLPSQGVLDVVTAALSPDSVRPLCDEVVVAAPTRVPFTLEANITIYASADLVSTQATVQASGLSYLAGRRAGLGRDLVASQALKALGVDGVYKVELVNWVDRVLAPSEWADGTLILHMIGSANG